MKILNLSRLTAILIGVLLVSCVSEDDNPVNPNSEEDVNVEEFEQQLYEIATGNICIAEQTEDKEIIRTPRFGEELRPGEFYILEETQEKAKDLFRESMLTNIGEEILAKYLIEHSDGKMEFSIRDFKLTFIPNDDKIELATITIDWPEMPDYKTLHIVSEWPVMSGNKESPFSYGVIYHHKLTGRDYVCVRKCGQGSKGLLLTFDGGWYEEWFKRYAEEDFCIPNHCASRDAIDALIDLEENNSADYTQLCKNYVVAINKRWYKYEENNKSQTDPALIYRPFVIDDRHQSQNVDPWEKIGETSPYHKGRTFYHVTGLTIQENQEYNWNDNNLDSICNTCAIPKYEIKEKWGLDCTGKLDLYNIIDYKAITYFYLYGDIGWYAHTWLKYYEIWYHLWLYSNKQEKWLYCTAKSESVFSTYVSGYFYYLISKIYKGMSFVEGFLVPSSSLEFDYNGIVSSPYWDKDAVNDMKNNKNAFEILN